MQTVATKHWPFYSELAVVDFDRKQAFLPHVSLCQQQLCCVQTAELMLGVNQYPTNPMASLLWKWSLGEPHRAQQCLVQSKQQRPKPKKRDMA